MPLLNDLVTTFKSLCDEGGTETYCTTTRQPSTSYSTPTENRVLASCMSAQISSPKCKCSYPYSGNLVFRAPSFSSFGNVSLIELLYQKLMLTFGTQGLPPRVFQSNTAISRIGFVLSNQTFKPPHGFGPFYFVANNYEYFAGLTKGSHNSSIHKIIIEAAAGESFLFLLLLLAGVYAFFQKRRAEMAAKKSNPFASWNPNTDSGGVPQIKGAKCFSFDELKK